MEQIVALDEDIYQRGLAIDKDKLVSLGQERFPQLLAHEREARGEQRAIGLLADLTEWATTFAMFARVGALRAVPVRQRTTHEQLHGLNLELDEVREVRGFADLWKLLPVEPRAVLKMYNFRDAFESLTLVWGSNANGVNRLAAAICVGALRGIIHLDMQDRVVAAWNAGSDCLASWRRAVSPRV